jgi:hypothetical protein
MVHMRTRNVDFRCWSPKSTANDDFPRWLCDRILIIQLKRFDQKARGLFQKNDAFVDFPFAGLDLTDRVLDRNPNGRLVYYLNSIVNHKGVILEEGHCKYK